MNDRIITVFVERQPELYDELVSVMMSHGEYQGSHIEQYTEYHEDGQTIAKFTLRERDLESTGEGANIADVAMRQ